MSILSNPVLFSKYAMVELIPKGSIAHPLLKRAINDTFKTRTKELT